MNKTTPYEDLIAARLNQIPVPDMADSIWAGIEMQLDAVADTTVKKSSPKSGGKGWYGFIATIIVVALLYWYYTHKNHVDTNATPVKNLPATEMVTPVTDSNTSINSIKKNNPAVMPVNTKKDIQSLNNLLHNRTGFDSAAKQNLPPVKKDSLLLQNNRARIPVFDSANIIPPVKKPKGVKGITNDDYKISGYKDSVKKGG